MTQESKPTINANGMKTDTKPKVFTEEDIMDIVKKQMKPADDTKERMSDLIQKVAEAKAAGVLSVETNDENIKLIMPNGLAGKKYCWWNGVRVCQIGMTAEIDLEESKTVHDRLHPESKTRVISGTT